MKFIIATHNRKKITEISSILSDMPVELKTLDDFKGMPEVEETEQTLQANALLKARSACKFTGLPAIADDTGLEVDALGGKPGVMSARYSGENSNDVKNVEKLISEMAQVPENKRKARFRCSIALVLANGEEYLVEGISEGRILYERSGAGGFGYDPVFLPDGYTLTFAELPMDEKNKISHRGRALNKMKEKISEILKEQSRTSC